MAAADQSEPSPAQLAELSALADGTLDPGRARALEARIAASPALSDLYQRERYVVELLHQARAADRAPAALRARIEAHQAARQSRAGRRWRYAAALAAASAAAAAAFASLVPGGETGGPSIAQAATLAARGPAQPAPAPSPSHPQTELAVSVDRVHFPNWSWHLGWRAIGQRRDTLSGRLAVTVYYQRHGLRVAYTIVDDPALPQPPAHVIDLSGTKLRTLTANYHTVIVTWRRAGYSCVLSSTGVPASQLQALGAWTATRT